MRVYVAGPMTGIPDYNYPAFNEAARRLRAEGHEVLNPADSEREWDGEPLAAPWDWYLRRALRKVTEADAVALLPGWEASRGAALELHVAHALGLLVAELADWVAA